jgi:hypothetical protein
MSCCIQLCCLTCYGCFFGIAWVACPSFRKRMREEWARDAKEDEEFDRRVAEMTKRHEEFVQSSKARLDAVLAKAEAQKQRDQELAKDPEIQAKVKQMVAGGIPAEEALRACVDQIDQAKIRARTDELVRDGIPRLQAAKMAQKEVQWI